MMGRQPKRRGHVKERFWHAMLAAGIAPLVWPFCHLAQQQYIRFNHPCGVEQNILIIMAAHICPQKKPPWAIIMGIEIIPYHQAFSSKAMGNHFCVSKISIRRHDMRPAGKHLNRRVKMARHMVKILATIFDIIGINIIGINSGG